MALQFYWECGIFLDLYFFHRILQFASKIIPQSFHRPTYPSTSLRNHDMTKKVQSGRSGLAKHGGAYFSAVYGFTKDPIAAPGPYENQEC